LGNIGNAQTTISRYFGKFISRNCPNAVQKYLKLIGIHLAKHAAQTGVYLKVDSSN
jgi:hypothetical protein